MKVTVVRSGGFAGFVTRRTLDADALPSEEGGELRRLVHAADLASVPQPTEPTRQPDRFQYELTVQQDDGTTRVIRASEEQLPGAVRSLAEFVVAAGSQSAPGKAKG